MARDGHFGDAAGVWNAVSRDLWQQLGMNVPLEALSKIRQIRSKRNGRQGNTEMKREVKILLACRDGMDWRNAELMEIDHIISMRDGGKEIAGNLRLVISTENIRKGARSILGHNNG